ncbi:MAG: alpha/beta fold hydrolase, partial [Acidobacteriota bacterium]
MTSSNPNRRLLVSTVLFLVCAPFLGVFAMDLFVRQMLYPAPPWPVPATPPAPLEALTLESSAGDRISAWLRARPGGDAAVLFLHGNGENLATLHASGLFDELDRIGASTLAIDYPGYGRSTGKPGEASLTAAGIAGFKALQSRFPGQRHFIVGWSLGAATAAQTAVPMEGELAGLVLLSPWHDLPSLASRFFPGLL